MTARTIFIIYFAFISGGIPAFLIFIVILYTLTSESAGSSEEPYLELNQFFLLREKEVETLEG